MSAEILLDVETSLRNNSIQTDNSIARNYVFDRKEDYDFVEISKTEVLERNLLYNQDPSIIF